MTQTADFLPTPTSEVRHLLPSWDNTQTLKRTFVKVKQMIPPDLHTHCSEATGQLCVGSDYEYQY